MRRRIVLTIAVALSGLLLVVLTGAATTSSGPITAAIPVIGSTGEPVQMDTSAPAPALGITGSQVDDLVRQREAVYRAQLDELTRRIQAGQDQVAALASQERTLGEQLAQLEQARQARTASYQSQLGTLQEQYGQRFAQYAAQLQEVQARLAEANALLGQ